MPRQKQTSKSAWTDDAPLETIQMPKPPLSFSDTAKTLEDLVKTSPPHCVIQCTGLPGCAKNTFNSNFNISQPLLAFMTRTVRKVSARCLQHDSQRNELLPMGNGILIPDDYPGWFAVLGPPNRAMSHQRVSHYTKLSLLATSKCSHFLIGGKDPIRGVMVQTDERGRLKTTPFSVLPGTVLRKAGLFREEAPVTKEKQKKKKGQDVPQREFLKCFDEQDREMLIHTRQTGVFYIVSKEEAPTSPQILQMKDILRYKLPLIVKLIYGRVPTTPCAFSQVLLLTDHGVSRTLVVSTLQCYRNINVEIPLGVDLKFRVARNTPELLSSAAYVRALQMCKEQAPSYIRDMKVVFGSSQLVPDEATRLKVQTNQQGKQTPANQPLPDGKPAVSTQKSAGNVITEKGPASIASRMSVLSRMSDSLVISHDTFVIADQPASSQTRTPGQEEMNLPSLDSSPKMFRITAYDPPPPPPTINMNPGQGLHRSSSASEASGQVDRTYDNNSPLHCLDPYAKPEVSKTPSSSLTSSNGVAGRSSQEQSDVYLTSWEVKRTSTLNVPSKCGRPVSPGRSPVEELKQFDYITMQSQTVAPAPRPHLGLVAPHKAAAWLSSEPPPIPPRPRFQYSISESNSTNDSDSFTSLSEDSFSLSDWTTDEERNYINMNLTNLKRVENVISENVQDIDQQLTHSEECIPPYLELANVPDPGCSSTVHDSQLGPLDLTSDIGGYLDPLHVCYPKSAEDERSRRTTEAEYSEPDKRRDSGVFDDESGYSMVQESQLPMNTGYGPNQAPMPPPLPQRMSPGQALLRAVPATSKFALNKITKDMLMSELKKEKISSTAEVAMVGLELADIANLLSKDDDFDDDLFALLPQVGLVDLKKVAVCLRRMKFRN
ncbi:hypothetical protein BsWGS_03170 [Bradybaena similaris]